MRIIFDFDNTLISAKKVYKKLESLFLAEGVKKKKFQEIYRLSKTEGIFNLEKFIFLAGKNFFLSQEEIRNKLKTLYRDTKKLLYLDVVPFLRKWSKKADLFLISLGDKEFQDKKIKGTGILKFFTKKFIVGKKGKLSRVKSILRKDEKVFVVEDNPETLFSLKKEFREIITIRINRGEGKYKGFPNNKNIDFSIKSLVELEKLLGKASERPKALVLLSGGLDSILSVKVLKGQGVKVTGVTFKSFFFGGKQAEKAAREMKIPLRVIDFSEEHLEVVKRPKRGYGKAMNPCLDCHILMLKKAKEIMMKEKFDFVATGEVLGERPMSQNKKSLRIVERESGLEGYLLRPLSAKLLAKTIPEKLLLVNREKLLDIRGRSRKKQMALAKKFGMKEYPTPAGGCLLTDLEFSKRLKELFKIFSECGGNDIELLKRGRHFWEGKVKIVVGRNERENKDIKKLSKKRDIIVEMKNYPGPTTLIRNYGNNKISKDIIRKAKELTQYYSLKARDKNDIKFSLKYFSRNVNLKKVV